MNSTDTRRFGGISRLYGGPAQEALSCARICVVGLGGVGSWCVEALARTGIGQLTLIDGDCVAESNVNRQLPALSSTIGLPKAEALAQRVRDINPNAQVCARTEFVSEENFERLVGAGDVIVDAIYGSGFHGEIDIRRRQITQMINEAIAAVFSLDIPSGINCDTGEAAQDAVNADFTIAFDSYKPAHLLPKYLPGLGQVSLAPIGIDSLSYEGVAQNHFVAGEDYVYSRIPQRQPDAHKTSTGKLLNIAGGIGCTGAAVLSSTAAMRSGAGYVVTGVPQAIYPIIAPSLVQSPFCFIETAADVAGALTGASAIAIGCGMGTGQRQRGILEEVLYLAKCPVVIDADGINNLAMDISIVADAKCPVILTPHFGEMAKICRTSVSEIQKAPLLCAQELAAQLKATIVLKGAHTIISSPDGSTFINQTGNPGLAKAGSGDVLTGILASLISQGMPPFEAAVCAVYLHGAAADRCIERMSEYFMQPDDILIDLGRLLKEHIR